MPSELTSQSSRPCSRRLATKVRSCSPPPNVSCISYGKSRSDFAGTQARVQIVHPARENVRSGYLCCLERSRASSLCWLELRALSAFGSLPAAGVFKTNKNFSVLAPLSNLFKRKCVGSAANVVRRRESQSAARSRLNITRVSYNLSCKRMEAANVSLSYSQPPNGRRPVRGRRLTAHYRYLG